MRNGVGVGNALDVGQREGSPEMRMATGIFQSVHPLDGGFAQANRFQLLAEMESARYLC